MFKVTRLVTFHEGLGEGARLAQAARHDAILRRLPGLLHARTRPSLEGSVNGGDSVLHLVFESEAAWHLARSSTDWQQIEEFDLQVPAVRCDWVTYQQQAVELREPRIAGGIHRILLLSVMPQTPMEKIARFEAEMCNMARYLPSIRNWGFSRISDSGGVRPWTHVWEQDFACSQDLFGPYMMHPIHFGQIDRWFDPQSHDWIVDTELCSTYCAFEQSALALFSGSGA